MISYSAEGGGRLALSGRLILSCLYYLVYTLTCILCRDLAAAGSPMSRLSCDTALPVLCGVLNAHSSGAHCAATQPVRSLEVGSVRPAVCLGSLFGLNGNSARNKPASRPRADDAPPRRAGTLAARAGAVAGAIPVPAGLAEAPLKLPRRQI